MKKLIKMLPILGLVLAAVFALAFTVPMDPSQPKYGFYDNEWYDASEATEGDEYLCDLPEDPDACTRVLPNYSAQIVETGEFIPVSLDPMEE